MHQRRDKGSDPGSIPSTGKKLSVEIFLGHDHLLEIRLLKKSARHDFIIARHHMSKWQKSEKWLTIKKYLPYVYFEQFHFETKKYQLLELQMVDKGFGKCQLLDTIYCKENGVHVRQLG